MNQNELTVQRNIVKNETIREPQFPSLMNTVTIGLIWFVIFSLILKTLLPKMFVQFRTHPHILNLVILIMFIGCNFFIPFLPFVLPIFDQTSIFPTMPLAISVLAGITFPIGIGLLEITDVVHRRLNQNR